MHRNYFSLLDFILIYFLTKLNISFIINNNIWKCSKQKHYFVLFLLMKDILNIPFIFGAGTTDQNYTNLKTVHDFGFYWTNVIVKISLLLTL